MSLRRLVKHFDTKLAVADVSLEVPAGSFYGLLGPNGAGKTTTLSMAVGLLRPDAGEAILLGHDVGVHPAEESVVAGAPKAGAAASAPKGEGAAPASISLGNAPATPGGGHGRALRGAAALEQRPHVDDGQRWRGQGAGWKARLGHAGVLEGTVHETRTIQRFRRLPARFAANAAVTLASSPAA